LTGYSPHIQLALAREREADLLRDARRREVATKPPKRGRPSALARLVRRAQAVPRPAAQPGS
jgi:hypothetical protein